MVDKKVVRAQIWDTAGLEQYKPITSQYFKGCAGAVIVYDVSNHLTYENTKQWLKELKDCSHTDLVMLVGNKTDLGDFRVVSTEEGKAFAGDCLYPSSATFLTSNLVYCLSFRGEWVIFL
jgi:small GTP-binding protein